MKAAYSGIKGAYSEAAIYRHFTNIDAIGFDTFEEVFDAVRDKAADYGMLPFENTIAGSVVENYDLLLNHDSLYITAEVFLNITHSLLSHKGNNLANIKTAYSHPHAIAQCRDFLKMHNISSVPLYDTAGSAKYVSMRGRMDESAIAAESCADIYNLEAVRKGVESVQNNITKFFVVVRAENLPPNIKKEKTSIAFTTKHYPGALVNCLQRLAKNSINLTKLESRPVPKNPWEYVFYADFEGGVDDENVKIALSEMEAASEYIRVLGSYPKGVL